MALLLRFRQPCSMCLRRVKAVGRELLGLFFRERVRVATIRHDLGLASVSSPEGRLHRVSTTALGARFGGTCLPRPHRHLAGMPHLDTTQHPRTLGDQ